MLHDVCVRPGSIAAAERIAPIWGACSKSGVQEEDCRWHPYWRNEHLLQASPEQVKVSLYSRGAKGALLVVSNLGAEEYEATVRLNLGKLTLRKGMLTAKDALTGEALPPQWSTLRARLGRMTMRMAQVQ